MKHGKSKKKSFTPKYVGKGFLDWAELKKRFPRKAEEIERHEGSQEQLRRILLRELRA